MNFTKKPKCGFVLGKFMPPHKGHVFLCDFAQNYVEHLTILVCSLPDEPIPGELRYKWMKELFPNCNVVHCTDILPQYPEEHPDFWNIWKDVIKRYSPMTCSMYSTPQCVPIDLDVIFASEAYGKRLAEDQGAQFVPCDIARTAFNCSGTAVREDPWKHWNFIPDVVKPYYTKRVCMVGVESTGKTTIGQYLADKLSTVFIPEYGRTYTEFFGTDVKAKDIQNIVNGHIATVKAATKMANKLVIEDTDPVMSAIWSDMLIGKRNDWFATFDQYADLYLLCDIDIPWANDGTRYFSNDVDRKRFHDKIEHELIARKLPYYRITGDGQERLDNALLAVLRWMAHDFEPPKI